MHKKRAHTMEKPFSCDVPGCQRKFTTKGELDNHQGNNHPDLPPRCKSRECGLMFKKPYELFKHKKADHKEAAEAAAHKRKRTA